MEVCLVEWFKEGDTTDNSTTGREYALYFLNKCERVTGELEGFRGDDCLKRVVRKR